MALAAVRPVKTIRRKLERVEPVVRVPSQAPVAAAVEAELRVAPVAQVMAARLEAQQLRHNSRSTPQSTALKVHLQQLERTAAAAAAVVLRLLYLITMVPAHSPPPTTLILSASAEVVALVMVLVAAAAVVVAAP
ncbi:hypothetical protein MKK84_18390 [Methylobacterium sp. E-065]|uniref:hypothetical protein n=1 Tax=Methylobacterium sp. E-065 TaxID=2836583 RepID=UPI001FB9AAE2|nr:hypothetical protein [Methylobacterium sp. E-065]MCJ2019382.1 hypothetical protein [Methylobacterium sp. E-065]